MEIHQNDLSRGCKRGQTDGATHLPLRSFDQLALHRRRLVSHDVQMGCFLQYEWIFRLVRIATEGVGSGRSDQAPVEGLLEELAKKTHTQRNRRKKQQQKKRKRE